MLYTLVYKCKPCLLYTEPYLILLCWALISAQLCHWLVRVISSFIIVSSTGLCFLLKIQSSCYFQYSINFGKKTWMAPLTKKKKSYILVKMDSLYLLAAFSIWRKKNIGSQCAFTQNGKAIGKMILSRQRAGKEFATHLSSIFPFLIPASNVELPSKRQTQTAVWNSASYVVCIWGITLLWTHCCSSAWFFFLKKPYRSILTWAE